MFKKISVLFVAVLLVFSFTSMPVAAASDIVGPSVVHKEANQVFTIMDLLSMYDLDVFIETDGYTGYGNVPGDYTIVISQGSQTKNVSIIVVEDWGNLVESNDVLFVTDYKDIYVSNDRMLSLYEIIYYIFDATGYVTTEYQFRYEEILDEYHYSFDDGIIPEGKYELTFRLTYYTGEQATHSASINVVELQELPGMVLEPPPTTIDKIMSTLPLVLVIGVIVYLFTHRKKKRGFN
ncbi:MAG: hypothetical protein ACTSU7_00565 [Candidatus Heimdallarchaeaceae archaeon]